MANHDIECSQVYTISRMENILEQMSSVQLEDRRERREHEGRIMDILERVADQGARLNSSEKRQDEFQEELNSLYGVTRGLEKEDPRLTQIYLLYSLTTAKPALYCYIVLLGLLAVNTGISIVEHTEIMSAVGNWVTKIMGL